MKTFEAKRAFELLINPDESNVLLGKVLCEGAKRKDIILRAYKHVRKWYKKQYKKYKKPFYFYFNPIVFGYYSNFCKVILDYELSEEELETNKFNTEFDYVFKMYFTIPQKRFRKRIFELSESIKVH
ncbi:MAG: hypothetical protein MUC49_02210 [Raineya sp.]|jgi:hypothetical protein|nr:hypothetical protein [Raineya sp.]